MAKIIYLTDDKGRFAINVDNILFFRDCKHSDMQKGFSTNVIVDNYNFLVKESEREIIYAIGIQ